MNDYLKVCVIFAVMLCTVVIAHASIAVIILTFIGGLIMIILAMVVEIGRQQASQ